jgi:hypothetical protein
MGSFAAMDVAYEKVLADPKHQALSEALDPVLESQQIEFYVPLA